MNPPEYFKLWLSRSIRNKITFYVLLLFLIIYMLLVLLNYAKLKNNLFKTAEQEALGTAQIIAVAIYRNFHVPEDFREIQSFILGSKRFKNNISEINVISRDLEIICSTNDDKLLTKTNSEKLRTSLERNEKDISLVGKGPVSYLKVIYPISGGETRKHPVSGILEITISLDSQTQQLARVRYYTIAGTLIIMATMGALIVILSGSLTRPIGNLYRDVKKIEEGDLDASIDVKSSDEIGYLASSFSKMVNSVKVSRQKLEEYASRLEQLKSVQGALGSINADNLKPLDIPAGGEIAEIVETLNSVIEDLSEAFKRERSFISSVAHELRTPLSEIRTSVEVMLKWPENMDVRIIQTMDDILQASINMQSTISNLLTLSRLDSGFLYIKKEKIQLKPLIEIIWKDYKGKAGFNNIGLNTDFDDVPVYSDTNMIHIIFDNLLSNAVEYSMRDTSIEIITCLNDDSMKIAVCNSPSNLSKDDIPFIFNKFWRKNGIKNNERKHSGLGLSIVQSLAEYLHYELDVDMTGSGKLCIWIYGIDIHESKQNT